MLGSELCKKNRVPKPDLEGMRVRAQLWQPTKDLPEGQKVVFQVKNG